MTENEKMLYQTGYVFMLCLWIQSIMINLLILKKHQKIIDEFNKASLEAKFIPKIVVQERNIYYKQDFGKILNEFIDKFQPNDKIIHFLKEIKRRRDCIGHSCVSFGRDYIFHIPDSDKKHTEFLDNCSPRDPFQEYSDKPWIKLSLGDQVKFSTFIKDFQYLDEIYFKKIAEDMRVMYSGIR